MPVAPVIRTLCPWRSQSPPASAVIRPRSSPREPRQSMSSMQALPTLSLAALSSRVSRLPSRQSISRCTSMASRSSKASSAAALLVAWSARAWTMPSRRSPRSWSRVCSLSKSVLLGRQWWWRR